MTAPETAWPSVSILIPAYNEAAVIARTLRDLTAEMQPGEFQIIVIANACHDDTAAVARAALPQAVVLDTPQGGKTNAVNLGFGHATAPVIACLDADLSVPASHIRALTAPLLAGQASSACGRMDVDLSGCSWAVRQFYAAWSLNPYLGQGKFGGLWALSRAQAQALFPLPPVIADDEFVSRSADQAGKAFVPECCFTVRAPRDLASLARIRRRSLRGTRQIAAMGLHTGRPTGGGAFREILKKAMFRPSLWVALFIYVAVMVQVRVMLALEPKNAPPVWERDESSRIADELTER